MKWRDDAPKPMAPPKRGTRRRSPSERKNKTRQKRSSADSSSFEENGDSNPDKDGKFKRYELEIGIPGVKGDDMEKDVVVEAEVRDTEKGGVRVEFDNRTIAKLNKLKDDFDRLNKKVMGYEDILFSLESDIRTIKEDYSRLEVIIGELEGMRDSYSKVDKTIRELSALYDLISAHINPFIDFSPEQSAAPPRSQSIWDGIEDNVVLMRDQVDGGFAGGGKSDGAIGAKEAQSHKMEGDVESIEVTNGDTSTFQFESEILKWLKFLQGKMRAEDIPNLLKYYRELGWINENIEVETLNFLTGSKIESTLVGGEEDIYLDENGTIIGDEEGWKLSIEDHANSLEYIREVQKHYKAR